MWRKIIWRLALALIALAGGLGVGGCAPGSVVIEDSGTVAQRADVGMVSEPSAESTNEGIWVSMQGGG
jgi:hypothetical protein